MIYLVLLGAPASAASFVRVPDWPELAARSHTVVAGVVTSADTLPAPSGVVTRYRIEVTEVLTGEPEAEVVLELPGGRVGDLVQRFGGVPLWSVGAEVVVFVPPDGRPALLTGVLTIDGDQLVDPLARPAPVRSVDELRDVLDRAPAGTRPD
jgi:hypothetical protein